MAVSPAAQPSPPDTPAENLINLRVAWEHVEAPFEAFVYFLDELGVRTRGLRDHGPGRSLSAQVDDWFPFLSANELGAFGAVAVFRYRG